MSLLCNKEEYIKRMESSIAWKLDMLDGISGDSFLDFGCGSGMLTSAIKTRFPEALVVGYDESKEMIKVAQTYGTANYFTNNYGEVCFHRYDVIILCSVLHEVYSYGNGHISILEMMDKLSELLNPNGKIIIRDGFKEDRDYGTITITHKNNDSNFAVFAGDYIRDYKFEPIPTLERNSHDIITVSGNINAIKEFVNKYTWGWTSYPREIQEQVNCLSLRDYLTIAKHYNYKMEVRWICQEDYFEYVEKTLNLSCHWDTHLIVIYTKRA